MPIFSTERYAQHPATLQTNHHPTQIFAVARLKQQQSTIANSSNINKKQVDYQYTSLGRDNEAGDTGAEEEEEEMYGYEDEEEDEIIDEPDDLPSHPGYYKQ